MGRKTLTGAGRKAAASLNMNQVAGLWAWWDVSVAASVLQDRFAVLPDLADDDGEPIGALLDQTGNARHLRSVTGDSNRPTLKVNVQGGKNGARFDAIDDYLRCDAVGSTLMSGTDVPFSIAWVGKKTSTTGHRSFWGTNNSADADSLHRFRCNANTSYNSDRRDNGGGNSNATGGTPDTNTHAFVLAFSGTAVSLWVDGSAVFSAQAQNVGAVTMTSFSVGAWFRNAAGEATEEFLAGDLYEMGVYDNDISANAVALSAGLITKWGVV